MSAVGHGTEPGASLESRDARAWPRRTDHPMIVRTSRGTTGGMDFEAASPHLMGGWREPFAAALRTDVSLFEVERAKPTFREMPEGEATIEPEVCTPYVEANAQGYLLKNILPLVFVRTRKGEVLPEARVAVKYMRENAAEFADVLALLARHAPRIFRPEAYEALKASHPLLASDIAQPYASFSDRYMVMRAGCYAVTPPGIATLLGPPVNRPPLLPFYTGLMETEWFHSQFVLVFDCPRLEERVLLIEPGTALAQISFVSKKADAGSEVTFSEGDPGADPAYRERSIEVGLAHLDRGKSFVLSEKTGVKSVSVACPHCWVSITRAAEEGVPPDHVEREDFYQAYKVLRAQYRREFGPPD